MRYHTLILIIKDMKIENKYNVREEVHVQWTKYFVNAIHITDTLDLEYELWNPSDWSYRNFSDWQIDNEKDVIWFKE